MFAPLVSSNPKLGTSGGALGAYIADLGRDAPPSMFGVMGTYSTTDSFVYGAFGRAFLGEDQHRIQMFAGGGKANNDYQDFLGSGLPVQTTDDFKGYYASYLYRVAPSWFLGGQAFINNYAMLGANDLANSIIDILDLGGFNSNALGLRAEYDSRDNTQSPASGRHLIFSQLAYREALGGNVSFDVYNLKWRNYFGHGEGSVFAQQFEARYTHDAPNSGYSTLRFRGYIPGELRAPNVISWEGEERYYLAERWRLAAFAGVGCLHDDLNDCTDSGNLYASGGVGVHFVLRPKEKMVVRLDYARGEGGSEAFYMKFGQEF
ncbi:hypothetical protein E4634_19980 [Mangrovimicrobium sediminis]|uniref:Bacterial surface antigen (D15) domain-containing protein n=1 Tax=Mangrovimicrobium sediminis TaxID=2562682 RepID=A0A4Z0LV52_9GAMM|nr:hypothetical protein [Haliea sp. SAOS-164]TGD71124.1 hypothetical protein E4634_19980 [Haliea sp. SAOS-164]